MKLEKEAMLKGLKCAVTESFETMAFADIDNFQVLSESPNIDQKHFYSSIKINEPFTGNLEMIFGEELAEDLFDATVGDTGINYSSTLVDDLISEISNTVAGCFLRNVIPGGQIFKLGLPTCGKVAQMSEPLSNQGENRTVMECDVDDHKLYFVFDYTEEASSDSF